MLLCIFLSANEAASQALQAQDVDLAEAVNAVEKQLEQVSIMRTDDKFQCVYNDAVKMCTLGIEISAAGVRRGNKSRPTTMQDFVMGRFVSTSSDALPSSSDRRATNDVYFLVLDASLNSCFNSDCITLMKLISSFVWFGPVV